MWVGPDSRVAKKRFRLRWGLGSTIYNVGKTRGGGGYKRSERKSEMQRKAMNRGSLPSYSPPNLFSILASLPEGNFPFR